ncbi:MAG: 50S ribosomal protein L24 [Patescibacteria group bacterium]|nr:50S ribosomal protein L24 [Patescibacteria group bacterium]
MKIHKDDTVKILLGKDLGKTGKVLRVLGKENKVLVEGINTYKRHGRKTARSEAGIFEITKPVNISNVALICPNCKEATRIGFKIDGKSKSRFCKKCKEVIK